MTLAVLLGVLTAQAQVTKASLQASGLTCSMCSKAVYQALSAVPFVEKVQVDIKNQQYNLTFKPGTTVDFDALSKAVQDAGFSVAALRVTAHVDSLMAQKDTHVQIGSQYFHFLNASGQSLSGEATFNIVDKDFVTAKEFKKWSAASKMACVKTGRAANCCAKDGLAANAHVYHVII
jgi:copper chaperone CopZ